MKRFHNPHLPSSGSGPSLFLLTFHLSLVTLISVLLTLAFAGSAFSQQRWERTYGWATSNWGYSVQQTSDGGYVVTGFTGSYPDYQVYLVKTNASGDTLWTKIYGGPLDERGYSVQQTSDGGYIVAGYTYFTVNGYQVYLIKTDVSGDTLWTRTYGWTRDNGGSSVQQTSNGGYIIAGYTGSSGNGAQVYLVKTNAFGDTLWTRNYGGANDDGGSSVQQTSDGGYIVTGFTGSYPDYQVYLVKTNASGDTLWTRTYGGPLDDRGNSVQQTSDGGYVVAGSTNSSGYGSYDVYLIKTNASGDTLWTRTYGGVNDDYGYSVQQTSDGGYIVAGSTNSLGNDKQVYLIKTNASGDTLWTRNYGGPAYDYGYSVRQTNDGGYIVAGESYYAGYERVYLIKTDANGNVGVEEPGGSRQKAVGSITAKPNPFVSFVTIPGQEAERFNLYDISGRKVGTYKGDRIGEGLGTGVYFLKYQEMLKQVQHDEIVRIVKVR